MAVQQYMYLSKNKAFRTIGGNSTNTKTELKLPGNIYGVPYSAKSS